jgi:hypothetical protein
MGKRESALDELRRKVAAEVPPELVEREMIKVLACAIDGFAKREHRLRAVIQDLLAERRAGEPYNTTPQLRH